MKQNAKCQKNKPSLISIHQMVVKVSFLSEKSAHDESFFTKFLSDSNFHITLITKTRSLLRERNRLLQKLICEKILLVRSWDVQSINIDYKLTGQCLSGLIYQSIPPGNLSANFQKSSDLSPRAIFLCQIPGGRASLGPIMATRVKHQ